jgi:hypothetical protein
VFARGGQTKRPGSLPALTLFAQRAQGEGMAERSVSGVKGPVSPTRPAKLLKTRHRPRREQYPLNTGRSPATCRTGHIDRSRYGRNAPKAVVRRRRGELVNSTLSGHWAVEKRPCPRGFGGCQSGRRRSSGAIPPASPCKDDSAIAALMSRDAAGRAR